MDKNALKLSLQKARIDRLQASTKPPQMPSVASMAKNVVHSVVQNVQSVAAGNTLKLSDQEANNRLDICKSCDFFNSTQTRCNKCGCFMAVKTYLKAEKCPIGKW
jgi:hypothetical protein